MCVCVCVCLVIPGLFRQKESSLIHKNACRHTQFNLGHINPHPSKCSQKVAIIIIIIRSCFVVSLSHTLKKFSCSMLRENSSCVLISVSLLYTVYYIHTCTCWEYLLWIAESAKCCKCKCIRSKYLKQKVKL